MPSEFVWAACLLVGVVIAAALVNRYAPQQRPRVRRLVILFAVYVFALGGAFLLGRFGFETWAKRFRVAEELLRAFNVVNLAATVGLAVLLPSLSVAVPLIVSDLIIGVGYMLATLGVLASHGFNPSSLLATSAVVSAVLAISLQSTLGNILGGVALQLDGSIHEGDWIQFDNGRQGRVRAVRWRHTVVETRDWSTIIVPNALLLANNIMILGKRDGVHVPQRMWAHFNVDHRYAPARVIEVVETALRAAPIEGVAAEPRPDCVCIDFAKEMGQSFITYGVRYWLPDMSRTDGTASAVRARMFAALKRADIPLALPATTAYVQVEDEERAAKRSKRERGDRLRALRTVPLFRSLTPEELEALAEGMHHAVYAAGETMTRQGAVAHWLYVMIAGTAEVRTRVDPDGDGPLPERSMTVATLVSPAFFGEMGLITGEPRLADVVAITDVTCYRLGKETLEAVIQSRPEIASELSETLAARRVELIAVRDGLDASAQQARRATERERILGGIKEFFGL